MILGPALLRFRPLQGVSRCFQIARIAPLMVRSLLRSELRACRALLTRALFPTGRECGKGSRMLTIELDREDGGRWIGEVTELPGVMAYGNTDVEAKTRVQALALRVIADRIEHGEAVPINPRDYFMGA